jgi:hypothetical protein
MNHSIAIPEPKKGNAACTAFPFDWAELPGLEVDAHHGLDVAWIAGGAGNLSARLARAGTRRADRIDVIEGIQELTAEFQVLLLAEPDFLHQAQVEVLESRSSDIEVQWRAVAAHHLDTTAAVRGRDVGSGWNTE